MRYQFDIDAELEYEASSLFEEDDRQTPTMKIDYPTSKGRRRSVAKARRRSNPGNGQGPKAGGIHRRGNRSR